MRINGHFERPGECGFVSLAANTVLAQQVPADCKLRVCDGLGSVKTVTYPSDVPISDNNSCTKEVCQNGVPTYDVLAMKGKACNENGGKICDGSGVCGECQDYWGCPDQGECLLGKCQAPTCNDQIANGLESGTDCGGGEAGSGDAPDLTTD